MRTIFSQFSTSISLSLEGGWINNQHQQSSTNALVFGELKICLNWKR